MKKMILLFLMLFVVLSVFNAEALGTKSPRKGLAMTVVGAIFVPLGASCLLGGISWGVYHQIDPVHCPGSLPLGTSSLLGSSVALYINPAVLGLNLTGIALLGIGIPVLAVGVYKMKKSRRMSSMRLRLFDNVIPEVEYNIADNKLMLGARLYL